MSSFLPEGKRIHSAANLAAVSSIDGLRTAMERGETLEAKALSCDHEHNLRVELPGVRGVIPREEGALGIRDGSVRDIALLSRVGRAVCFTVKELVRDDDRLTAILSRADAQEQCVQQYLCNLCPGDVIPARVTHLEPFGAFCDIGCGMVALMPIDAISVSRIEHPDERFTVGMDIFAVVRSIVGSRVTLSHKELLGTWEENIARYAVGDTVTGVIRSIENYGAFVELAPNLAGLAELRDNIHVGDTAAVYIKSILPQKMKVKLIIIDHFYEPRTPSVPEYYITAGHIDSFIYSPSDCSRLIMTEFDRRCPENDPSTV